jgi:hypothetical protein
MHSGPLTVALHCCVCLAVALHCCGNSRLSSKPQTSMRGQPAYTTGWLPSKLHCPCLSQSRTSIQECCEYASCFICLSSLQTSIDTRSKSPASREGMLGIVPAVPRRPATCAPCTHAGVLHSHGMPLHCCNSKPFCLFLSMPLPYTQHILTYDCGSTALFLIVA